MRRTEIEFKRGIIPKNGGREGIAIISLMIAVFILTAAMGSFTALTFLGQRSSSSAQLTVRAHSLAKEELEAARAFRDATEWDVDGLGQLAVDTAYHPELSASPDWIMVAGPEIIDNFSRQIVFESVERDGSDNIVESGGTLDPNTRKVIAAVSWQERGGARDVQLTTYLTNYSN